MRDMEMISAFIEKHRLHDEYRLTAESYFLPIADTIYQQFKDSDGTFFVGINGCQGSGKSTFTDFIAEYLTTTYQLNVIVMSLDDFYLSSDKRQQLAQNIHPLLATRGVPSTHDIDALNQVLTQLTQHKTGFAIPKFSKATDEPLPESQWPVISKPADIVLLEGWCWGVKAQTEQQLSAPINELELQSDPSGKWRTHVNEQLERLYQPLYKKMNYWIGLQAPSFDCVYKWRLEQEQKLQDRNVGLANSKIMTPEEILNFTQYFQRLSVQGSQTVSKIADAIFYLDYDRHITKMTVKES